MECVEQLGRMFKVFLQHLLSSHILSMAMFGNSTVPKWNGTVHGPTQFPNFFFLKINSSILVFLYQINHFFITFQIKKSLQNKIFHFFI